MPGNQLASLGMAGPAISTGPLLSILAPPVRADGIRRLFEPLLIVPQLRQRFGRKKLGRVSGRMAERFEHPRAGQNGNLMGLEAEIPRRFQGVQPDGKQRQSEKRIFIFLARLSDNTGWPLSVSSKT